MINSVVNKIYDASKMIYAIIGLVLIGALVFFITSCKNKSRAGTNGSPTQEKKGKKHLEKVDPNDNPYLDLRNLALSATMEQIAIDFPANQTRIYGVIMDWEQGGEGTATLVVFLSGDASLYLSSGGGSIGGSGHEKVKNAALDFIYKSEQYLSRAVKTDSTSLPGKDAVKFYFLTNKGKFVAQEEVINFENNTSQWLDLFEEGNKVITKITIMADMKE